MGFPTASSFLRRHPKYTKMNELIEQTRKYLNEEPDDGEQELLTEIILLRTGMIGAGLAVIGAGLGIGNIFGRAAAATA